MSDNPFSPKRARADTIAALPGVGLLVGALLGAFFGWFFSLDPTTGSIISGAGIGMVAGLIVGVIARSVMQGRQDR